MPEFKRNIGGPNLNIPGVSAKRPVNADAAKWQAIEQIGKIAITAGGKAAAKSAGEEIKGEDESAVAVDQSLFDLEADFHIDAIDRAKPRTKPEMEDFKKAKFDEVLTSQKRITEALGRGLISSTEASARLGTLRNEALSNPFIAMFQDELDNALFSSTGGGRGGTKAYYGATAAEKDAASIVEARRKGKAESEQRISKVANDLNISHARAARMVANVEADILDTEALKRRKERGTYNSKHAYTLAGKNIPGFMDGVGGILSTYSKGGGNLHEATEAIEEYYRGAIAAIGVDAKDKDGNTIMNPDDYSSLTDKLTTLKDGAISSLGNVGDLTASLKQIKEMTAKADLSDLEQESQIREVLPMLTATRKSPVLNQLVADFIMGRNSQQMELRAKNEPTVARFLELMKGKSPVQAAQDLADFGDPSKELSENAKLTVSTLVNGNAAYEQWSKSEDPESVANKLEEAAYTTYGLANDKTWFGSKSLEVLPYALAGAIGRDRSSQMSADKDEGVLRSLTNILGVTDRVPTEPRGLPTTLVITPRKKLQSSSAMSAFRGGEDELELGFTTGGTKLTTAYKKSMWNTYRIGLKAPSLWQDAGYESNAEWVAAQYVDNKAIPVEAPVEEEPEKVKEPVKRRRYNLETGSFE